MLRGATRVCGGMSTALPSLLLRNNGQLAFPAAFYIARSLLTRTLSTTQGPLDHNAANSKIGIGGLQLTSEELQAEKELREMLPEFQNAMNILHGNHDDATKALPNTKKAALALPQLERTADICRSAMGFQSVYLMAALRHLLWTYFMQGNHTQAYKALKERGDLMNWPITEHERMLRLLLRENDPQRAVDWCQSDALTKLYPKDETIPMKFSVYELIAKRLLQGTEGLDAEDPLFIEAVEKLRQKKDITGQENAKESLLSREIPYLMSQYAGLCLVKSDSLSTANDKKEELSDKQQICLNQAELIWKEALTWVEKTTSSKPEDDNAEVATIVDASFEAYIHVNLGELLIRQKKHEEAMEYLGKALKTQQNEKSGNALGLSRVLGKIAVGCHALGQAVSSEGLFTTVVESFEKEAFLSITDQVEYARVLRAYGDLLANWEKREAGAKQKYDRAAKIEQEIARRCREHHAQSPLHPVFYLPL